MRARRSGRLPGGARRRVCYPKANGLGTDLNRDILRVWLQEKGLIAVAQIAVDDVWSGLRFKLEDES